jgi:3-isopropylmalate/(R)-2-methylmalate dehydratase small subunit
MIVNDTVLEVYGDNVSAEQIAHARFITSMTPEGLADSAMKVIDPDFHEKLKNGKIMAAGNNFGCNSSREWAPAALYHAGVALVIAQSYSRIFYRNAINIGLPILECAEIGRFVAAGDKVEVDLSSGLVRNKTSGKETKGIVLPRFLLNIINVGGLMESLRIEREGK